MMSCHCTHPTPGDTLQMDSTHETSEHNWRSCCCCGFMVYHVNYTLGSPPEPVCAAPVAALHDVTHRVEQAAVVGVDDLQQGADWQSDRAVRCERPI